MKKNLHKARWGYTLHEIITWPFHHPLGQKRPELSPAQVEFLHMVASKSRPYIVHIPADTNSRCDGATADTVPQESRRSSQQGESAEEAGGTSSSV